MSVNEYFLEVVVRYHGENDGPGRGVKDWSELVAVADAVFNYQADPINNLYGAEFDTAPRTPIAKYRRRTGFGFTADLEKLHAYSEGVSNGAEMMQRLALFTADFSTPREQETRIDEAHSIGGVLSFFLAAAQELTDPKPTNPLEFARRRTLEIKLAYLEHPRILSKLGKPFDHAVVGFVNEHLPLDPAHRITLTELAMLGRMALTPPDRGGIEAPRRRRPKTPKP